MSQTAGFMSASVLHLQLDPLDGGALGEDVAPFREARPAVLADHRRIPLAEGDSDAVARNRDPEHFTEEGGSVGVADSGLESAGEQLAHLLHRNLLEGRLRRQSG